MKSVFRKVASLSTLFLLAPVAAFASDPDISTLGTRFADFGEVLAFIDTVVNILFTLLLAIAVIFIIVAAFKYLTSHGDPEKVSSASKTLIYALVAVVVALVAKGLVFVVKGLFGAA